MKQLHAIWFLVTTGVTALSEIGMGLIDGTKIKFRSAAGALGIRTVLDDTDIVTTLSGNETNKAPSVSVVKTLADAAVTSIAVGSQSMLQISAGALSVTPLLMTRPVIDTVSTTLALALAARSPIYNISNVGNNTADLQLGDTLILTSVSSGTEVWLHNGGALGTTADFTSIEASPVSDAAIRALLSGQNGIGYNNLSGIIKLQSGVINESIRYNLNNPGDFILADNSGNDLFSVNFSSVNIGHSLLPLKLQTKAFRLDLSDIHPTDLEYGNSGLISDNRFASPQFGLRYQGDYGSSFVARSLVDKGYVDAQVSSAVSKSNVTVTTTAGNWTNVIHGFNLSAGNFDNLVVSCYDSSGELVALRLKTLDANTIQVMTADAVIGLRVRMIKTA